MLLGSPRWPVESERPRHLPDIPASAKFPQLKPHTAAMSHPQQALLNLQDREQMNGGGGFKLLHFEAVYYAIDSWDTALRFKPWAGAAH